MLEPIIRISFYHKVFIEEAGQQIGNYKLPTFDKEKLERLREVISENLRVQKGSDLVNYISIGTALQDAKAKQNHTIFARRGCGKTLLLHHSARTLKTEMKSIYLNCEEFKRHSFPNVLIEILWSIFSELNTKLTGWFGRKRASRLIIVGILGKLQQLRQTADIQDEDIRRKSIAERTSGIEAGFDVEKLKLGYKDSDKDSEEIERSFKLHQDKLRELDLWLPDLKRSIQTFF